MSAQLRSMPFKQVGCSGKFRNWKYTI